MKRKHFLLIGSAMLCLVLLLSACGLKSAAPSPTPGAVINVTDLGGVYAEDVAHRGSLTLTPLNATAAKIVIDWPFSANQSGHWEMTGSYDAGTGALIYNDGVLTEQTYDAQGNPVDNMVYSGGSGRFRRQFRRSFLYRVPAAAVRALAVPFRGQAAADRADITGLVLGHLLLRFSSGWKE